MSRDQLKLVQKLADRQEKEAASRLSSAQGSLASAQGQLNQVLGYRSDYHRLAIGADGTATDTGKLQTARKFLSELDGIAGRQQKTVQQAELLLEQHRTAWIEAKRRQTAISRLREARASERSKIDERRHQQVLDALFLTQRSLSVMR